MSTPPEVRARLGADRTATLSRLASLEREQADIVAAAQSANGDDEHDPEGATIAFEREHAAALARQARQHLADIDAALARLAAGRYGTCVGCGAPVSPARLEARPVAATCITCATRR
ncbi:MAG TPA: TraR/DksA family transcriptional regulator [Streptosporangiaceae bacterium]|jgi:RNA polymerase-binding transcription factor DksA